MFQRDESPSHAPVVKVADTSDLGSDAVRCAGSNPVRCTKLMQGQGANGFNSPAGFTPLMKKDPIHVLT